MNSKEPITLNASPVAFARGISTDEFFEVVYDELKGLAGTFMRREQVDHTLSATALVNEAYVRLASSACCDDWNSRAHFFAAAAEAMRRILIDRARSKLTQKRKGTRQQVELDTLGEATNDDLDWLLDLDESLEQLSAVDSQAATFVKMRLFGGRSVVEAGKLLGLSRWSAYQLWDFATSWFAINHSDRRD